MRVLFLSLSIIAAVPGCQNNSKDLSKEKSPDPSKVILATIDEEQVTLADYKRTMNQLYYTNSQLQRSARGQNTLTRLQKNLVDELINRRIMLKRAKKLNLAVSEAEIDNELKKFSGDYSEKPFEQILKQENLTLNEWRQFLKQELLIKKLIYEDIERGILIKDQEIKAYYKENINEFKRPERVKVRQIVVADEAEAESILKKLRKGKDFAALARENSLSPEGDKGGEMPYFSRGDMPAEFESVAFSLKNKGDISNVFKTGYGYHIFKLMDYQKPRQIKLNDAKKAIIEKLRSKKIETVFSQWINNLKAQSKIKINPYFVKNIQ